MALEQKKPAKWVVWLTLGVWLAGLASVALAWCEARWYVFHPHYLPLGSLFVLLAVSTLVVLARCLRGMVRGPHRGHWALIAVVAVLPAVFWAFIGVYAQINWSNRRVPNALPMDLAKVMGATLMRAEAEFRYPHRLETDRLVMFYDDLARPEYEVTARPELDLAEMEQHVVRMAELLGETIDGKIYWIRGSLLGQSYLSFHGLALGSDHSPYTHGDFVEGDYRGDRHELAHAALDWFRLPDSDPPYVLHEGWAMSQCGDGPVELATEAANARRENPSVDVRELFGPDWYDRDAGAVYTIGGAFVDFLLRKYGGMRFRRFYTECRPDNVESKCREVYEIDLDDLEIEFWQHVQATIERRPADEGAR